MLFIENQKGYVVLLPLYTIFLVNVKRFGYKIEKQLKTTILTVEQNNFATKIVNVYFVYELDNWSRNLLLILH